MSRPPEMLISRRGAEPARVRVLEIADVTVSGVVFRVAVHAPLPGASNRNFRLSDYRTGMALDGTTVPARYVKDYKPGMLADAFASLVARHGAARVLEVMTRGAERYETLNR